MKINFYENRGNGKEKRDAEVFSHSFSIPAQIFSANLQNSAFRQKILMMANE